MNNGINSFIFFVVGAAVGTFATTKFLEKKFNERLDAEIESIKEYYREKNSNTEMEKGEESSETIDATSYNQILKSDRRKNDVTKYTNIAKRYNNSTKEGEMEAKDKPFVISPDEFGTHTHYETFGLTYYADQILTDDSGEIIYDADDIERMIGAESLTHFGEYEDDSVHVQNDEMQCYFEILLESKKYSDIFVSDENG